MWLFSDSRLLKNKMDLGNNKLRFKLNWDRLKIEMHLRNLLEVNGKVFAGYHAYAFYIIDK